MPGIRIGATVTDLTSFPLRLGAADMRRIFGYSRSRFHALVQAGAFDRFELTPRIGARSWSRAKVQDYLDKEK